MLENDDSNRPEKSSFPGTTEACLKEIEFGKTIGIMNAEDAHLVTQIQRLHNPEFDVSSLLQLMKNITLIIPGEIRDKMVSTNTFYINNPVPQLLCLTCFGYGGRKTRKSEHLTPFKNFW